MAFKSNDAASNKPLSFSSANSIKSSSTPYNFIKNIFSTDPSICSTRSRSQKSKKYNSASPYLANDAVFLYRNNERTSLHKKVPKFPSSFPLAVNIYKANSDELNSLKRTKKKVKKSVLTLPNEPVPMPQVCTVSDMNDSEYFEQNDENRKIMPKKRPLKHKKLRARAKNLEFYDRDARYCSQLNIDLDHSSTEMINYNGDTKRNSYKKQGLKKIRDEGSNFKAHDVWTILRNINRFQFQPSAPVSEESIVSPKKKKGFKRKNNCKDECVIETRCTEEFAFVTSYEIDKKSHNSFSPSTSVDRITVIDKQDEFNKMCQEFGSGIINSTEFLKEPQNTKHRPNKRKNKKNTLKTTNMRVIGYNNETKESYLDSQSLRKKTRRTHQKVDYNNFNNKGNEKYNHDKNYNGSDHTSYTSKGYEYSIKDENNTVECVTTHSSHSGSITIAECEEENKKIKDARISKVYPRSPQYKGISKVILSRGRERTQLKPAESPTNFTRTPRVATTISSTDIVALKVAKTENIKKTNMKFSTDVASQNITEHSNASEAATNTESYVDKGVPHTVEVGTNKSYDQTATKSITSTSSYYKDKKNIDNANITKGKMLIDKIKGNKTDAKFSTALIQLNRSLEDVTTKKPLLMDSIINTEAVTNNEEDDSKKHNTLVKDMKSEVTKLKQLRDTLLTSATNKSKTEIAHPTSINEIKSVFEEVKKQKPFLQLRDRMMNLLYKKLTPSIVSDSNYSADNESDMKPITPVLNSKQTPEILVNKNVNTVKSPTTNRRALNVSKPRWAKAKWASDFIENVMKNIKIGVYYTHDSKHKINHVREISTQTSVDTLSCKSDYSSDLEVRSEDPLNMISDNNNALPALEVQTLNSSQISIKHCVKNVIVQFDVTIPTEKTQVIANAKTSSTLIPLDVTESQTKIFKCKTTIVNAMLPAELCTIVPQMMRSLVPIEKATLPLLGYPMSVANTESHLSTITEITRCESTSPIKYLSISVNISSEVKRLLSGVFSKDVKEYTKHPSPDQKVYVVDYSLNVILGLLPNLITKPLLTYIANPFVIVIPKCSQPKGQSKALESLHTIKKNIIPAFSYHNLTHMIEKAMENKYLRMCFTSIASINQMRILYDGRNITVDMSMRNIQGEKKDITISVSNMQMESLFKATFTDKTDEGAVKNKTELKCIEDISTDRSVKKIHSKHQGALASNKHIKKGFFRLRRKCKSTANISCGSKSPNVSLDKIKSLDDFLQILGSKKWLSSVFDGCVEKKILSSLMEMKSWLTDINPRQALLVLLLTNKKDTRNLVRFRPILLQGIALNRITRATELDMEIEVIETENFYKTTQYEGIPCLPTSVENNDNLLEELYWIAKTTASDYQRPFDESSERLLKSLLEKRKKLNPSYLRVMARYVGLGLLKAPVKK